MLRYGIHTVELCHATPDYALYGLAPWPGFAVRAECLVSFAWTEATFSSEKTVRNVTVVEGQITVHDGMP